MIKIDNLCVNYGSNAVYKNFSLQAQDGAITCILGESGCGKTTLLNAIAGLVSYGGSISPVRTSYVFQSPRLIPFVTVLKNLTLTGAAVEEAEKLLQRVGLAEKAAAYPSQLSGGEAQRVALCRAFLFNSDTLLMDEPFSSLDLKTKLSVMELFVSMHRDEKRCVLFVTHDVDEALYLADRLIVLNGGIVVKDLQNTDKSAYGTNSPLREEIIKGLLSGEELTKGF